MYHDTPCTSTTEKNGVASFKLKDGAVFSRNRQAPYHGQPMGCYLKKFITLAPLLKEYSTGQLYPIRLGLHSTKHRRILGYPFPRRGHHP